MSRHWMPLYIADYLADTTHLSNAESGSYLHLIFHYWQRGSLPNDDVKLASIARAPLEQWLSMKPTIAEFFGEGWRHERIEKELLASKAAYERRASAGKKGGLAKSANMKATPSIATAMPEQCSSNHNHISKIEYPSDICPKPPSASRTRKAYPEDFSNFWAGYPTDANMSKVEAYKSWSRLSGEDRQLAVQSLSAFRAYCTSHPDYRPVHANRYLSQRRFEGHAKAAQRTASVSVVVKQNSQQGSAWDSYYRATKGKGVPWTNGTWHFPSEWPPELMAAE